MARAPKRFIKVFLRSNTPPTALRYAQAALLQLPRYRSKKVPPSGGPPAFKLTLPHQIVHKHLLHLVDADFDLAPSASAHQTWQGSIAPRRNKERSEYTLQGWKLFAEAHKVRAGDQVSFELVDSHRMVVQVIRPLEAPSSENVLSKSESPEAVTKVSNKAIKQTASCTPSRSQDNPAGPQEEILNEPTSLWYDSAIFDGPSILNSTEWPFTAAQNSSEEESSQIPAASLDKQCPLEDAEAKHQPKGQAPLTMRYSRSYSSSKLNAPPSTVESLALPLEQGSDFGSLSCSHGPQLTGIKRSLFQTQAPPLALAPAACNAGLYADFLSSSLQAPEETSLLDAPKGFTAAEGDMLSSGLRLSGQPGDPSDTFNKLEAQLQSFEKRACAVGNEISKMQCGYSKRQRELDCQSRGAYRLVTCLEKTTNRLTKAQLLSRVDNQTAEMLLNIQSDMLKGLSSLKGNLWQILVSSLEGCDTDIGSELLDRV